VPGVPIGVPFEPADEQLDQAIAEMLEPANWPGFDDFVKLAPELNSPDPAPGSENGNSVTRLSRPHEPFVSPTRHSPSRWSLSSSR
jgi:hypothetical protein